LSDAWKRTPEFIGWLKAPSADRYVRDLRDQRDAALQLVLGAASCSEDPKVRERYTAWKTLNELHTFLAKSRTEKADEIDE
jgi:hypothetical protein